MPQLILPIFPKDLTYINEHVGFQEKDGQVYYFIGLLPVFSHAKEDLASFRFITSQLVVGGNVKQIEISQAFGIPYVTVKRNVAKLRKDGPNVFFKKTNGRSAHILTPEVLGKAQRLLDKGHNASEIGRRLNIKGATIRKAIQSGKLKKKLQKNKN